MWLKYYKLNFSTFKCDFPFFSVNNDYTFPGNEG